MTPLIVVDYNAGNLTSVMNAFAHIGVRAKSSKDPDEIAKASRLVFPGVGAAASAMKTLTDTGIGEAIRSVVRSGNPVLGICIGCQIVLDSSDENGGVKTLGLIPGCARRFKDEPGIKIPQMGWNQVEFLQSHPLFEGMDSGCDFYFVHSYHPAEVPAANAFAKTTYGSQTFTSAVGDGNLFATQFHLEKSGDVGLQVLKNFSKWVV